MRGTLRIARPTARFEQVVAMYREGLGLEELGGFEDHGGFDGVMLGHAGQGYHLEFTTQEGHVAPTAPTEEHLLVFYISDDADWQRAVDRIEATGCEAVEPANPYWAQRGKCYRDPDGYVVVLQRSNWPVG